VAAGATDNPAMQRLLAMTLACLVLAPSGTPAGTEITVYRCEQSGGRVTLQDAPCPEGQAQTTRNMTRPQDPPPRAAAPADDDAEPDPDGDAGQADAPAYDYPMATYPPPPLFQCTDYDGAVRYSEYHDPNTRCVPLAVLGYPVRGGSPGANTCRMVTESCLRLDDASACDRFKRLLRQARSDALHAFSDTAAFRRSEVIRLERIVSESCR